VARTGMHWRQSGSIRSAISIRQTVLAPQRAHVSALELGKPMSLASLTQTVNSTALGAEEPRPAPGSRDRSDQGRLSPSLRRASAR
jgi:hypothetical protein